MKPRYELVLITIAALIAGSGCASRTGQASRSVPAGPVYTATAEPGVIPAGTELVVRTNERIETDQALPGRTFSAEVERAIVDSRGTVIVPENSPAQLRVLDSSRGGTVGTAQLELAVQSLTVGGRTYDVVSDVAEQEADRQGLGANRRTAEMVGGGAVLGTLIGAIAGGGTGAAIGAAAGAAGGAAVQVLTRGSRVNVPAETVLTFKLDQPIRLRNFGTAR